MTSPTACTSFPSFAKKTRAVGAVLAISISALLIDSALAQLQWDINGTAPGAQGGSGDWLTSNGGSPWWDGVTNVAWVNGGDALFSSGAGIVTAGGVTVDDITFVNGINGPYTLTGSITLGMGDSVHEITSTATQSVTISASITGTNGFVKLGSGSLTLSGVNTFSGPVMVNQGTLTVVGATAVGPGNSVTIANGTVFQVRGDQTIGSLSGAGMLDLGGRIDIGADNTSTSFSGSVVGGGFVSLVKNGLGTLTLSGIVSHSGGVMVNGGTLKLTANNTYVGATGIFAGTLEISGGNAIPDGSAVTISAGGTLQLMSNETVKTLAGDGLVGIGANTLVIGTGDSTFSGTIFGTGSVEKAGAGRLTLNGSNTFTGGLTIRSTGVVAVTSFNSQGTSGPLGPGPVTLDGGGLRFSGTGTADADRPFLIAQGGAAFSGGLVR